MVGLKIGDTIKIPYSLTRTVHTAEGVITAQTEDEPVGEIIDIQLSESADYCAVKISKDFGTVWFGKTELLKLKEEQLKLNCKKYVNKLSYFEEPTLKDGEKFVLLNCHKVLAIFDSWECMHEYINSDDFIKNHPYSDLDFEIVQVNP